LENGSLCSRVTSQDVNKSIPTLQNNVAEGPPELLRRLQLAGYKQFDKKLTNSIYPNDQRAENSRLHPAPELGRAILDRSAEFDHMI
jgi:hypothetical protein